MEGFGGTGGLLFPPDPAGSAGVGSGCALSEGHSGGGVRGETDPELG